MREHGFCFREIGQRGPNGSRSKTEAVPATPRKGRRPGAVPFGPWPDLPERLWYVAPFVFGKPSSRVRPAGAGDNVAKWGRGVVSMNICVRWQEPVELWDGSDDGFIYLCDLE